MELSHDEAISTLIEWRASGTVDVLLRGRSGKIHLIAATIASITSGVNQSLLFGGDGFSVGVGLGAVSLFDLGSVRDAPSDLVSEVSGVFDSLLVMISPDFQCFIARRVRSVN